MGKYTITYSCGHEGTESLFGKHAERDRYIAWASKNKLCPACFHARTDGKVPHAFVRASRGGIEIYLSGSYAERETLRARGYRFGEYTSPDDPLGLVSPIRAWGKVFTANAARAELEWIRAQRWEIEPISETVSVMFQSIGEGREDLLK